MTRKVSQYMAYKSGFHRFVSCIWNCKYHKTLNSYFVSLAVAPCIILRWFVYPCRYCDMITRFGISVWPSCILNQMLDFFYVRFSHMDETKLSSENLINFANAVHNKGGAFDNYWVFMDGLNPISTWLSRSLAIKLDWTITKKAYSLIAWCKNMIDLGRISL